MTEPVKKTPEQFQAPGQLQADDLFDLPVEALNVPGMDAIDTASALAEFERAEPEIAALAREEAPASEEEPTSEEEQGAEPLDEPVETTEPAPRLRRVWIAGGAFVVGIALMLGIAASKRAPAPPLSAEVEPPTAPAAELPPPGAPETEKHTVAKTNPVAKTKSVREISVPASARTGHARLQVVQGALESGRRAFARVELGRMLLDIDSLPAGEREDTRAEAELLVARILQDAADEARRSPR